MLEDLMNQLFYCAVGSRFHVILEDKPVLIIRISYDLFRIVNAGN